MKTTTIPYLYQVQDRRRIHQLGGRALVAWDMGLGKTFLAYSYAVKYNLWPMVVVCPASIKWQWEEQARYHYNLRADVLEGRPDPSRSLPSNPQILIVNYDILSNLRLEVRGAHRLYKGWAKVLRDLNPKLLVFDECQALQGRGTKRTRSCYRLAKGVKRILALSGTPLLNRPMELFPTLNILCPYLFPSWWPYAQRYCNARRDQYGGWDTRGSSHTKELNRILRTSLMVRRTKAEVLSQLPKKQRTIIPVDIKRPKEYQSAVTDFLKWLAKKDLGRARRAAKAEQIVKLGYLKQLAASLKMAGVIAWVDDFLKASDGKLVLFAVHRKIIKRLCKRYADKCVRVDGSVTGKYRQAAFRKFITSKKCRILVGNIKAAGVGWSGKGVGTVGIVEFPWTPGACVQAEDRIYGIGRGVEGERPQVFYFPARKTIEEKLLKLLQDKQGTIRAVLDKGRRSPDDLDIWDLLSKELKRDERRRK